jgi:predicted TIM-barrel fold metal-dependent hydrolase
MEDVRALWDGLAGGKAVLRFFDCDIGIGATGLQQPAASCPEDLLPLMDRYGIERAIVYDRTAVATGVFDRFERIVGFCRASDRLCPSIPVAPSNTNEGPPLDDLLEFVQGHGIGAVRVFPRIHGFDFDLLSFGDLLERLEAHRVPVFYHSMALQDHPWAHRPDWRDIREVALAFPRLPIVVLYTGMLQGRRVLPLLASCPNVLTDLTCSSFQYIEYVCEHFGSGRLVMASHYPMEDPGLYTLPISYAKVPQEAKESIAFGTVQRLVEGIQ